MEKQYVLLIQQVVLHTELHSFVKQLYTKFQLVSTLVCLEVTYTGNNHNENNVQTVQAFKPKMPDMEIFTFLLQD